MVMKHEPISTQAMLRQYKRRVRTLPDGSKFIPLEKGLFDVFSGVEWLQHSRYRYANNRWIYLQGVRQTADWIEKNMPDFVKERKLH